MHCMQFKIQKNDRMIDNLHEKKVTFHKSQNLGIITLMITGAQPLARLA